MNNYILFLDESGYHELKTIDQQFPIFLLCGVIFEKNYYENTFIPQVVNLKNKHFDDSEIILHSRDIRKWQNDFISLGDINKRSNFYKDVDDLLSTADYKIISAGINKNKLIETYGPQAGNPYNLSLTFILERTVFLTDSLKYNKIEVIAESRGKVEDSQLHNQYQVVLNNGTKYIEANRFVKRFFDIEFKKKYDNLIGTQICDLVAYVGKFSF